MFSATRISAFIAFESSFAGDEPRGRGDGEVQRRTSGMDLKRFLSEITPPVLYRLLQRLPIGMRDWDYIGPAWPQSKYRAQGWDDTSVAVMVMGQVCRHRQEDGFDGGVAMGYGAARPPRGASQADRSTPGMR